MEPALSPINLIKGEVTYVRTEEKKKEDKETEKEKPGEEKVEKGSRGNREVRKERGFWGWIWRSHQ